MYSLSAARIKASKEAVRGVKQSGVMADLLDTVLVVHSPDASPHILRVIIVKVLLNALFVLVFFPAGCPFSVLSGPCCKSTYLLIYRQHPGL